MKSRSAAELIEYYYGLSSHGCLPIQVADIQHCVENITKMFRHGRNAPDACVRNSHMYAPLSQQSRHPVNLEIHLCQLLLTSPVIRKASAHGTVRRQGHAQSGARRKSLSPNCLDYIDEIWNLTGTNMEDAFHKNGCSA
ncbi:hypothetical protein KIN20_024869 [Parelaphostrongylus tenuis]|uniref:Uncharacterized protein n=1 Tax=Parelaphostrongylus tenuis TaxID=148309 RepID=A0AAD5QW97_PARTN|nr:hypothetical protein KIN20_024869 [Parelaphostrongylus tenuis]